MAKKILLSHSYAPGDVVCMTACVRDLHATYPGEYQIHVDGSCPELWQNNPHIASVGQGRFAGGTRRLHLSYLPQMQESDRVRLHFLTAFHRALATHLGHPVPVRQPKGDLHLASDERVRPIPGRYWILVAGGKTDIETKIGSQARFQEVVESLGDHGIPVVQAGAIAPGHRHPRLSGVQDFVGRTSLREALQLVWHADGVICPVTFLMHVAAAFDKPCVVLAGGREPLWWAAYVNSDVSYFGPQCSQVPVPHRFLHTLGQLECCRDGACWKSKLSARIQSNEICTLPVEVSRGQMIPACLDSISAESVVNSVLTYYRSGELPLRGTDDSKKGGAK